MELLLSPEAWIAFFTLSTLEIVVGIDNIIFISILVGRLPPERRVSAGCVRHPFFCASPWAGTALTAVENRAHRA